MRFKLACAVLCVLFAAPVSSLGQSPSSGSLSKLLPAAVRQSGVLRVAGDASFPPFFYLDEKNQFQGFDVDIATAVARVLGLK
ncbi:MAG: transporter substrate-binding domain-containing protein, partial [Polyangiaceae bacterium]